MELIGRRWAGAILYALTDGPLHFAELKESVPGMSDRLLSHRLKELEEAGLVRREVQESGKRVRVSYELTAKGRKQLQQAEESFDQLVKGVRAVLRYA